MGLNEWLFLDQKWRIRIDYLIEYIFIVHQWVSICLWFTAIFVLGEYSCIYTEEQKDMYTITHKASGVMDISLKPNIDIDASPHYPRCLRESDSPKVNISCRVEHGNEVYNVTWDTKNMKNALIEKHCKCSFLSLASHVFILLNVQICHKCICCRFLWRNGCLRSFNIY